MKTNFYEEIEKNCNLVQEELLNLGFTKIDHHAVYIDEDGQRYYLVVYPELLYTGDKKREIWYAVGVTIDNPDNLKHYKHKDKSIELLGKFADILKKSKYKFFHDEDAIVGMFSHPKPTNYNEYRYVAYCNPEIPEGGWSNHALN